MGEKMSKAMIADLVAKGANVGPSLGESLEAAARVADRVDIHKALSTKIDVLQVPRSTPLKGTWTFRVPDWTPATLNQILYGKHWSEGAILKKSDAQVVAFYACGLPAGISKRSVSLHVVFPKGKRMPDPDAYAKSLLDSLVHCGMLVNDSSRWCVMNPVTYSRGESLVSFVTIEDLP